MLTIRTIIIISEHVSVVDVITLHNSFFSPTTVESLRGFQSPEQLQPIKSDTDNSPREKPEEWPPCFADKIKRSNRVKD